MPDRNNSLIAILVFAYVALIGVAAVSNQRGDSFISSRNSTTTVLGAGETFTGLADSVDRYGQVICFAFSDVASADGGYTMELSTDGVNWDRKKPFTLGANSSQSHTLVLPPEYFRVVYINGASPQTEFRLKCKYSTSQGKDLTSTPTEVVTDNSDVVLFRQSGAHNLDVARGLVEDHSIITKFGKNLAVGASIETIWTSGGDYTGFLTAGSQLEVLSDDVDDTAAGAGARTVTIEGLDVNFLEVSETVTLNGITEVTTTRTDWMRVLNVFVEDVGTYSATAPSTTGANQGTLTIQVAGGGAIMCLVEPEEGKAEVAVYTIPAGKSGYLEFFLIGVSEGANKSATVTMWTRGNADDVVAPFTSRRIIEEFDDFQGERTASFDLSIEFLEMTDIWFSGIRSGSQDAEVDVQFTLVTVPN